MAGEKGRSTTIQREGIADTCTKLLTVTLITGTSIYLKNKINNSKFLFLLKGNMAGTKHQYFNNALHSFKFLA